MTDDMYMHHSCVIVRDTGQHGEVCEDVILEGLRMSLLLVVIHDVIR